MTPDTPLDRLINLLMAMVQLGIGGTYVVLAIKQLWKY